MVPSLTWTNPLKMPVKKGGRESLCKGEALFILGGEWARGMWAEREPCKAWERDTIVPHSYPLSQITVKEAWGHGSCCSAWTHTTVWAMLRPVSSSQQILYAHSSKPFGQWTSPLSAVSMWQASDFDSKINFLFQSICNGKWWLLMYIFAFAYSKVLFYIVSYWIYSNIILYKSLGI